MARRGTTRSFSRGPKKRTIWENLSIEHVHPAAAIAVRTDISPEPMASAQLGSAKILRTIGKLTWNLPVVTIELQQVALGIAVVTNDAFVAGAIPDPISGDFQQSYYYWTSFGNVLVSGTGPCSESESFDIRSKRVLRSGYKLVLVSESPAQEINCVLHISIRNLWEID